MSYAFPWVTALHNFGDGPPKASELPVGSLGSPAHVLALRKAFGLCWASKGEEGVRSGLSTDNSRLASVSGS